jgi:hypothetical protein
LGDNASFCVSPHFFKNLVRFELETPHDSRAINQNEGATLAAILIMHGRISWLLLPAIVGGFLLWLVHYTSRRVDKHETDRLSWRKGALGEYEVGAELERLSDAFFIFNDVNTRHGNFDHVVVGPTGLFAIETKNWNGLIGADASDELRKNARMPQVRMFGNFSDEAWCCVIKSSL